MLRYPGAIGHQVRNTRRSVADKDGRPVAVNVTWIDHATLVTEVERTLKVFARRWAGPYPLLSRFELRHWEHDDGVRRLPRPPAGERHPPRHRVAQLHSTLANIVVVKCVPKF